MNKFVAKRATIIDVAQRAGVSPQTVSNVIYRLKEPRPDTLRRVTEAIAFLGYTPNIAAKALRSQRSDTIALLMEDPFELGIDDPLHGEFLQGVCKAARAARRTVIVDFVDPKETEERIRDLIQERRAGSLILSLGQIGSTQRRLLIDLAAGDMPIVLLQQTATFPGITILRAEDHAGAEASVDHLHMVGHKHILFLGASPDWPAPAERRRGVREACARLSLNLTERDGSAYTVAAAQSEILRALDDGASFTAVVAVNDIVALGAIFGLQERGLRVPGDCAVIGFNDFNFSAWMRPGISSIQIPGRAMGERAIAFLTTKSGDTEMPNEIVFPAKLIARESTLGRTPKHANTDFC